MATSSRTGRGKVAVSCLTARACCTSVPSLLVWDRTIASFDPLIFIVLVPVFLAHLCALPSSLLGADSFFCTILPSGHRLCSAQAFEFCLRPSTPLPTASMLGGIILGPNYFLLRPTHLDCDCLSLLAALCALPSSLLGPDPFLHHPALL